MKPLKVIEVFLLAGMGLALGWHLYFALDPDFGWHMRLGELILNHGLSWYEPFSYTMPSAPFFDHSWLSEVVMTYLVNNFGMGSLALIVTAMALLTVYLPLGLLGPSLRYLRIPLAVIIFVTVYPFFYIRPQVVSFFLFSVIVRLVFDERAWEKWRKFVPLIFLGWANLHGGFVAGLIVLGLKSWEGGKLRLRNVLVWGISLFVTLINPIGWNLWLGALSFSAEISTKLFIEELTPTLFVLDPVWIFYAAFSVALIWRFRADLDLWQKFVLMGFFLQGLFTVRYLIFWVILSLPFVIGSLKHFRREVRDRGVLSQRRFGVAIKGLMVWVLLLMVVRMFVFRPVSIEMSEDYYYPKLAVGYLRTYPSEGQYFSDFAWGGYLVWKLPEKKVFINGSMATLRRKESPEGETKAAFGDYIKLLRGELEVSKVFEKYNVDTFLWRTPKERKQDLTFVSLPDWLTGKLEEKKSKTLLEEVESLGWKEVYRDEVAVIYRKPE